MMGVGRGEDGEVLLVVVVVGVDALGVVDGVTIALSNIMAI